MKYTSNMSFEEVLKYYELGELDISREEFVSVIQHEMDRHMDQEDEIDRLELRINDLEETIEDLEDHISQLEDDSRHAAIERDLNT